MKTPKSGGPSNRRHWESIGAEYETGWQKAAKHRLSEKELRFVSRQLIRQPTRRALDVGIGNGRIIEHVLATTRTTELYGVDIAQEMVDVCSQKFATHNRVRDLRVCDVSAEALPFDAQFDFISAVRVLKYNANWKEIVVSLLDALVVNGIFVFSMPNRLSLNMISRSYDISWYTTTRRELEKLAKALRVSLLDICGFTKLPYFLYNNVGERVSHSVVAIDDRLSGLSRTAFARELFVAVKKTSH